MYAERKNCHSFCLLYYLNVDISKYTANVWHILFLPHTMIWSDKLHQDNMEIG